MVIPNMELNAIDATEKQKPVQNILYVILSALCVGGIKVHAIGTELIQQKDIALTM